MGNSTGISWTDATWNPIIGCSKVSEGCKNCYAEQMASRFSFDKLCRPLYYAGVINPDTMKWNGKVRQKIPKFNPISVKKRKTIFVCSMGDLFHESVPDEWIYEVLRVIMNTPKHRYMILTKRPERMQAYFEKRCAINNLALGVSVENQETANERIPLLIQTTATKRFISVEPMLGTIDLMNDYLKMKLGEYPFCLPSRQRTKIIDLIDLVICGGETGKNARPVNPEWVISLRDQCENAGVPFHFKHWGEWCQYEQTDHDFDRLGSYNTRYFSGMEQPMYRIGKKKAGRKIDGIEWDSKIKWG